MKLRRTSAALRTTAVLAATACALGVACGFPSVTFDGDAGGMGQTSGEAAPESGENNEGSVGADVTAGDDTAPSTDSPLGVDAAVDAPPDTTVLGTDAGAEGGDGAADAGMDAPPPVDTGSDAPSPPDAADGGGPIDAGTDVAPQPDASPDGAPIDSGGIKDGPNCDCSASQMLPTVNCTSLLGVDCTGSGFSSTSPPACGQTSTWYTCTAGVLSCNATASTPRLQECQ
jgi:hypothetical protein